MLLIVTFTVIVVITDEETRFVDPCKLCLVMKFMIIIIIML